MLPVTCSFILALYLYLSFLSKMKVSAIPVRFKPCGNSGSVQSVELSPCTTQPCVFHHGVNATVGLNFTSGINSKSLKTEVFGIIGGVPISFPMPHPDACESSGVTCPVESGTSYSYTSVLPVLKQYPSLQVVVKWQLVGESNDIVACVLFPIAIQSGDSKPIPEINPEPDYTKPVPEFRKPETEFHESELEIEKPEPALMTPKLEFKRQEQEMIKPEPLFHRLQPEFHQPESKLNQPRPELQKPKSVYHQLQSQSEPKLNKPESELHQSGPVFNKPRNQMIKSDSTFHQLQPQPRKPKIVHDQPEAVFHQQKPLFNKPESELNQQLQQQPE